MVSLVKAAQPQQMTRFFQLLRNHASLQAVHLTPTFIRLGCDLSFVRFYSSLGATLAQMPSLDRIRIHCNGGYDGEYVTTALLLCRFKPTRRVAIEFEFRGRPCFHKTRSTELDGLTIRVPAVMTTETIQIDFNNDSPADFYGSLAAIPCFQSVMFSVFLWSGPGPTTAQHVEITAMLLGLPFCFQRITFEGYKKFDSDAAYTASAALSQVLVQKSVTSLGITCVRFQCGGLSRLQEIMTAIRAESLRELELSFLYFDSADDVLALAKTISNMHQLDTLKLQHQAIPDIVAHAFAQAICQPMLRSLAIRGKSELFLQAVGSNLNRCVLLQECDVQFSVCVSAETNTVRTLLEGCINCPDLERLLLPRTSEWLLDSAAADILGHCRKLVHLTLYLTGEGSAAYSSPKLLVACKKQGMIENVELAGGLTLPRHSPLWDEQFRIDLGRVTYRNKESRIYKDRFERLPKGDTLPERDLFARALASVALGRKGFQPQLVYLGLRTNLQIFLLA